ncbi:MAG: nucleotidyl transferase AbiEii/AbiGii toxin family protein [Actinomycetota bacterium]
MEIYKTPEAFRDAIEDRLKHRAGGYGQLDWFRRMVVFERMLARLEHAAPGRWIVKGGTALEIRMPGRARRTRDLDMATREDVAEGKEMKASLVSALTEDPFEDWFEFEIAEPRSLNTDEAGRPGWRFAVDCLLAGRTFANVRVDVVARRDEISATERARVTELLEFAGLPAVEVEVVDASQHFAEKLHAYSKSYGERPNTRVRDLVDMVLLVEDGLVPDAQQFVLVEHVFAARMTHPVPLEFPDPPPNWEEHYEQIVEELDARAKKLDQAVQEIGAFWATTVTAGKE